MREVGIDQTAPAVAVEAAEYRDEHIQGAQHSDEPVDGPGWASSTAMTDVLTAAGFDAASVAGATSAWIRSGLPIEK